jgi:hypothetical protein
MVKETRKKIMQGNLTVPSVSFRKLMMSSINLSLMKKTSLEAMILFYYYLDS